MAARGPVVRGPAAQPGTARQPALVRGGRRARPRRRGARRGADGHRLSALAEAILCGAAAADHRLGSRQALADDARRNDFPRVAALQIEIVLGAGRRRQPAADRRPDRHRQPGQLRGGHGPGSRGRRARPPWLRGDAAGHLRRRDRQLRDHRGRRCHAWVGPGQRRGAGTGRASAAATAPECGRCRWRAASPPRSPTLAGSSPPAWPPARTSSSTRSATPTTGRASQSPTDSYADAEMNAAGAGVAQAVASEVGKSVPPPHCPGTPGC